jgi:DHA3 family tetracycline resistance protein-like MFS transporter
MLIFLLIGGVAVDRRRGCVMVASDVASGVVLIVAALAAAQRLEVWHVYVASMAFGFLQAFFFPAYNAVVPDLTPAEALPSANSLTSLSQQLSGIVGPAIGAWVVAVYGTPAPFSQRPVVLRSRCLRACRCCARPSRLTLPAGAAVGATCAWDWLVAQALAVDYDHLLRLHQHHHLRPAGRGATVPGGPHPARQRGTWAFYIQPARRARCWARSGWAGASAAPARPAGLYINGAQRPGHLASGWPADPGSGNGLFVVGLCASVFGLVWTNTLQELVPRASLGRVTSIDALGSFVLLPIGFGLAGWATDRLEPPWVFILSGAITAGLALAACLHPAIRNLE